MKTTITLGIENPKSEQAHRILGDILPEALNRFIRKNNDYTVNGKNVSEKFGVKGQFMKLHDKVAKLEKPLWNGEILTGDEPPQEILEDLLGHVLLALLFLKEGVEEHNRAIMAEMDRNIREGRAIPDRPPYARSAEYDDEPAV